MKKLSWLGVALLVVYAYLERPAAPDVALPETATVAARPARGDARLARAIAHRARDVQVGGRGRVARILADDRDGSRHQRFVLTLAGGHSVLVAHNIDLAPRIPSLQVGDTVEFEGEYVWNERGGVVHWTHHDPQGRHAPGWVRHRDRTYQ